MMLPACLLEEQQQPERSTMYMTQLESLKLTLPLERGLEGKYLLRGGISPPT
jgi:hypothetical protein